jgi:4-hydroxybenzoate polyprenyltransferase
MPGFDTGGGMPMMRARALIIACHPLPCLAVTAMATLLTFEAAPRGFAAGRLALVALVMLAAQLSVGWSNDAVDADRDAAAGRIDKPAATGMISVRALWLAAAGALVTTLALSAVIGRATLAIDVLMVAVAWAYNLGLKATALSGLTYVIGFGLLPAYSTSALPGHPLPRLAVTVAAALLGLGAHFANVLPDLAGDVRSGVRGLPQRVAIRFGATATRGVALILLLAASLLLLAAASPGRRWAAVAGLCVACVLAVAGALGGGKVPFFAAIAIAGVDVLIFAAGGEALTAGSHFVGSMG